MNRQLLDTNNAMPKIHFHSLFTGWTFKPTKHQGLQVRAVASNNYLELLILQKNSKIQNFDSGFEIFYSTRLNQLRKCLWALRYTTNLLIKNKLIYYKLYYL